MRPRHLQSGGRTGDNNKPARGNLTAMSEDIILETEELTKEFAGFVAVAGSICASRAAPSTR